MWEFIVQHQSISVIALYWAFSAAVSSMPDPEATSSKGYLWLFRFLHSVAGNLSTVVGSKIPGLSSGSALKIVGILILLPLCLSTSACASLHVTTHPGSLNATDSAAYDVLLVAEATIDQARTELSAGKLPDATKAPLNKLILSYNVTREAWLTYRGALSVKTNPLIFADQLNQDLLDLKNALVAIKGVK